MTEIESRLAIRELVERYSIAISTKDWKALGDTFVDDGWWELCDPEPNNDMRLDGRDVLVHFISTSIEKMHFVMQYSHGVAIELEGDTAIAQATMLEFVKADDSHSATYMGIYRDHLLFTDGRWRFRSRRLHVRYRDPQLLSGLVNTRPGLALA